MSSEINLLTIDDNKVTTDLERAGYRKMNVVIHAANDFQQADEIIGQGPIDIIVINYDYERVNGLLVCQHFKSQKSTKDIPIVFTSVQARPKQIKELSKAGMDLFVEQPVPRNYFIEKLRGVLDQKMRTANRKAVEGNVEFTHGEKKMSCTIADVSPSGLLLQTTDELEIEIEINMSFKVPSYKRPISVRGKIVRRIPPKDNKNGIGFGIRFQEFNGDSQKRLEKYLGDNAEDDPKLVYYL